MNAAVQTEEMGRRGRTKTKTIARKVKETCPNCKQPSVTTSQSAVEVMLYPKPDGLCLEKYLVLLKIEAEQYSDQEEWALEKPLDGDRLAHAIPTPRIMGMYSEMKEHETYPAMIDEMYSVHVELQMREMEIYTKILRKYCGNYPEACVKDTLFVHDLICIYRVELYFQAMTGKAAREAARLLHAKYVEHAQIRYYELLLDDRERLEICKRRAGLICYRFLKKGRYQDKYEQSVDEATK